MVVNEELYEQSLSMIEGHPELNDFSGPKPLELVELAESTLGLTFPSTYRQFLSSFGCGNFGSFEIYGIFGEDFVHSGVPDGIWYTLKERRAGFHWISWLSEIVEMAGFSL